MPETEDIGTFFKENKKLVTEYLNTKFEIYRLSAIRIFSKSSGYLLWTIISLLLLFIFIIFLGLMTAFWLSEITGSYTRGLGLTALFILVLVTLLVLFRKALFINPIVRTIIKRVSDETTRSEDNHS